MGFFSGGSLGGDFLDTETLGGQLMSELIEASGVDDSSVGGKFDKSYVSGSEYYAGLHLGFCHGPVDEVSEVLFRGKTGWKGVATPGARPINAPGYLTLEPRDQERPDKADPPAVFRTDPDLLVVNKDKLFGGERVEGGVLGIIEVRHGAPTQGISPYLNTRLKSPAATDIYTPAYRGVLSMVFHSNITSVKNYIQDYALMWQGSFLGNMMASNRMAKLSEPATHHTGFYWGAMNPSIKEVTIKVFRALQGWNVVGGCWYPEKCVVIRDGVKYMNPAHIAVQCLTDLRFGMKASVQQIGDSFIKAADRFHHDDWVNEYGDTVPGEAFGLGIVWTGEASIRSFLNDIMKYIYGNVYIDPVTGKLEIALVRKIPDDQIANLPLLGPGQIEEIGSFSRPTGEESVNTVTVIYTQLGTEKTEAVTKSNTAMTSIYNATISESLEMPGIKNAAMAAEVCERETMQRCSMAATYTGVRVTRLAATEGGADAAAFTLYEGAPFRLTWPPHGIVDQVFRATNIVQSTLEDNYIQFDAVEDAFALTTSQYVSAAPSSGWVNTNVIPDTFEETDLRLIALPYVTTLAAAGSFGMSTMPPDVAVFGVLASRDDGGITSGISVYTDNLDVNSGITSGQLCPTSQLDGALPILQPGTYLLANQVKVKNFIKTSEFMIGGSWFIVDDEKILCTEVVVDDEDPDYLLMTLERGLFDSVPAAHADGAKMWWFNGVSAARSLSTQFFDGDTPDLWVTAVGRAGETLLSDATLILPTPTLSNDWFAPYPPAAVKIDGKMYGDYALKKFTVEWDCRNRVGQSDVPLAWDAGGVTSEPGVTYTATLSTTAGAVQLTAANVVVAGPVGSITFTVPSQNNWRLLKVWANRDGYPSKQIFTHTITKFCGYGWQYGKRYGGASPGIILMPGESLPTQWQSNPMPCPRPVWGAGEWVHFDATLSADGQVTPAWEAPLFVTFAGGAAEKSLQVEAEAVRVSGSGVTSTAVLECARTIGPGAIYTFSEGSKGHQLVGTADATMATNYATDNVNPDYLPAASRVTNSITHDGTQYVFCFNYGADVYTAATDTFTVASVRKGVSGSPNQLGELMRANWIRKFGANFVACGEDLTDSSKTLIATSTDLLAWTIQNSTAPACLLKKLNWCYYPPDSCWYIFGTVGDQVTGSTYGYKTTNGYTITPISLGCPANAPCIGAGYVFTDNAANWYLEVIAGPYLIRKFNTSAWFIHRSLRAPEQLALTRKGGIPFSTSRPGADTSGLIRSYQSLVRTGSYLYDSTKALWNLGNQSKGAVLGITTAANTTAQDHDYTLIQPADHPYGNRIGAISDLSSALTDGGFKNSGSRREDVYGFLTKQVGQTTGYFEVNVGRGVGEVLIGVVAAMGPGETSTYRTSAALQQSSKILTDLKLSCPGGLVRGGAYQAASVPSLENTVVGVRFTQTGVSTTQCEFWVDNTLIATVENLLYDAAWFPVFTSVGIPLSLNLGQKPFQASTPVAPTPWA